MVAGDFIGTNPAGSAALANYVGVEIEGGASDNLIGSNGDGVDDATERDVISGNLYDGVWISGSGTDGNVVAGDFIGTDFIGTPAVGNDICSGPFTGGGVDIGGRRLRQSDRHERAQQQRLGSAQHHLGQRLERRHLHLRGRDRRRRRRRQLHRHERDWHGRLAERL